MMITMAIEAMAEAVVITEASGLGRDVFFDIILNTLFGARSYQTCSANITMECCEPGFKARLGLKDLCLATAAAERSPDAATAGGGSGENGCGRSGRHGGQRLVGHG